MPLNVDAIKLNGGYGSEATMYGVRAWCQHNSSHVVQGSGGLTGVTDNGTGDTIFNFSSNMPDDNYAFCSNTSIGSGPGNQQLIDFSVGSCRTKTRYYDLNAYNSTVTMILVR